MKPGDRSTLRRLPVPSCAGKRFAVIVARFYFDLTEQMLDGAKRALRDCGVRDSDIRIVEVPGCYELPLAALKVLQAGKVDAVVALGVVIRGETPHFDFVAGECARGLMEVQLRTGAPVGFGVLTTETLAQAEERADPARGDKGYDAGFAAASLLAV